MKNNNLLLLPSHVHGTNKNFEWSKKKKSNVKQRTRTPRCCILCDLFVDFPRHGFPVSCNKLKKVTVFVASTLFQDWPIYIIDVDCCLVPGSSPWCNADFLTSSCCLCYVYGGDTAMIRTTRIWLATPHHFQTRLVTLQRSLQIKIYINIVVI